MKAEKLRFYRASGYDGCNLSFDRIGHIFDCSRTVLDPTPFPIGHHSRRYMEQLWRYTYVCPLIVVIECNSSSLIATAVIMSITAGAPFKSGDSDLGVAYISVFLLVFFVSIITCSFTLHLIGLSDYSLPFRWSYLDC